MLLPTMKTQPSLLFPRQSSHPYLPVGKLRHVVNSNLSVSSRHQSRDSELALGGVQAGEGHLQHLGTTQQCPYLEFSEEGVSTFSR